MIKMAGLTLMQSSTKQELYITNFGSHVSKKDRNKKKRNSTCKVNNIRGSYEARTSRSNESKRYTFIGEERISMFIYGNHNCMR